MTFNLLFEYIFLLFVIYFIGRFVPPIYDLDWHGRLGTSRMSLSRMCEPSSVPNDDRLRCLQ